MANNEFLDLKTGKLRKVHPSLVNNKTFLAQRNLIVPPVATPPPSKATPLPTENPFAGKGATKSKSE